MKKLLLLFPILFILGCNGEEPEPELTLEEKRAKAEVFAKEYMEFLIKEMHVSIDLDEATSIDFYKTDRSLEHVLSVAHESEAERVRKEYTKSNYTLTYYFVENERSHRVIYLFDNKINCLLYIWFVAN